MKPAAVASGTAIPNNNNGNKKPASLVPKPAKPLMGKSDKNTGILAIRNTFKKDICRNKLLIKRNIVKYKETHIAIEYNINNKITFFDLCALNS